MGGENAVFSPQTVYRRSSMCAPDSCKLCELTDSHGNEIKSVNETRISRRVGIYE